MAHVLVEVGSSVDHFICMAGAPKEVWETLAKALGRIIASAEFGGKMEKLGYQPLYMEPEKYVAFWTEYEANAKNQRWVEMGKEK